MRLSVPLLPVCLLLSAVSCTTSQETWAVAKSRPSAAAVTNAPPLGAEAAMFYEALGPYGNWFWLEPYGWVWTPSGLDVAWRPYTEGSWAYTDCGWSWVSDFEWGWAPFHYGRWCWHPRHGWCWVPGSVWAPAWVSWHSGGGWCGWAPLPPSVAWESAPNWDLAIEPFAWCFVEERDFCRPHLRDHLAVAARNITLLNETKNVTRFEVRDTHVVNLSLSAEQIERATGRPVPHHRIVELDSTRAGHVPAITRNELRLFRPRSTRPRPLTTGRALGVPRPRATTTIGQLRQNELERRRLDASQAQQRAALESGHQRELQKPSLSLSPLQLQQRHQAEHRAFLDQLHREDELFESRAQEQYNRVPYKVEHALPPSSQARAGRVSRNNR